MLPICQSPEEAVAAIRSAPLNALRSVAWLEHEFLPSLGLHQDTTLPSHLEQFRGKGLQAWQWPNQFARYLGNLCGREIDSYLELGVSQGGTFILTTEYLRRFNPAVSAVGLDIEIKPGVSAYLAVADDVEVIACDTRSAPAARVISSRMWGLALIDANHSEEACWGDYQAIREFARLIAFHDITNDIFPGVGAVWSRVTAVLPRGRTFEFADQYQDVLNRHKRVDYGIGIVDLA